MHRLPLIAPTLASARAPARAPARTHVVRLSSPGCWLVAIINAKRLSPLSLNCGIALQLRPDGTFMTGHRTEKMLFFVAIGRAVAVVLGGGRKKGRFATPLNMPWIESQQPITGEAARACRQWLPAIHQPCQAL